MTILKASNTKIISPIVIDYKQAAALRGCDCGCDGSCKAETISKIK